jgi:hypothetical protein
MPLFLIVKFTEAEREIDTQKDLEEEIAKMQTSIGSDFKRLLEHLKKVPTQWADLDNTNSIRRANRLSVSLLLSKRRLNNTRVSSIFLTNSGETSLQVNRADVACVLRDRT